MRGFSRGLRSAAPVLAVFLMVSEGACAFFKEINGTTPRRGFVGAFAGPSYVAGNATAICNLLISTGTGQQVYFIQPDISASDPACSNAARFDLADTYTDSIQIKCTGPGQGYFFNPPMTRPDAPYTAAFQSDHYCNKFELGINGSFSFTFTQGPSANISCPEEMSNASAIVSSPNGAAGFNTYYPLGGALTASC